jgi:transcription initiation factor TFIIB
MLHRFIQVVNGQDKYNKPGGVDIIYQLNKKGISAGKDPMGIAATVLYIVCLNTGEKRTQTDIAQAAGITVVTLRNRYRDTKKLELDLIPLLFSR